jgi:hypothetical protein
MAEVAISNFEKRRLQAQVIAPIYDEMVKRLGEELAKDILSTAIQDSAIREARTFAEQEPGGETSMASFLALYKKLYKNWGPDCGLDVEVLREDEDHYDFDVTRCGYADLYESMGLGHLTPMLGCNRDGTFCTGYDPNIKLDRAQTIAQGAPTCTFRYTYEKAGGKTSG